MSELSTIPADGNSPGSGANLRIPHWRNGLEKANTLRTLRLYHRAIRSEWKMEPAVRDEVIAFCRSVVNDAGCDEEVRLAASSILLKADQVNATMMQRALQAIESMKDADKATNQTVNIYNQTNIRIAMNPADTASEYLDAIKPTDKR